MPAEICVSLEYETERAYLVNDGEVKCWIPKSKIKEIRRLSGNQDLWEITIPTWMAKNKGFV